MSIRALATFTLSCLALTAGVARTGDVATETIVAPHGVTSVCYDVGASLAVPAAPLAFSGSREGTLLWHRHFDDPIYTSTGLSGPSAMGFAGTWLNAPRQVEAVPLAGDGSPDWIHSGTEFYVDASRGGEILGAVDFSTADSTATVLAWTPDSATPLWTYTVYPCRSMTYAGWASRKPVRVSDDGSTVAAAIVVYTGGNQRGRLLAFDALTGAQQVDWTSPDGNAVALEISADGRFLAMAGWPTLYVYDRDADAVRWSNPIGGGNDALAISGDGRYLAWGWSSFQLREWTGSSYVLAWSHNPGAGMYVGQCALSGDNSALAVAWDNGNTMPNVIIVDLYELPGVDPAWHYEFANPMSAPRGSRAEDDRLGGEEGQHIDIPSHMRFSPSGAYLAVTTWGDDFPELHVFARDERAPVYTLDTPGSMFDLDIVDADDGAALVTCCGKSVHAGTGGRGGDFYAIEVANPATSVDGAPPAIVLQGNVPNPFNPLTTIKYTLGTESPVYLTVFDVTGRFVRQLRTGQMEGPGSHEARWDGTDALGHSVSSGTYFYRLETGDLVEAKRMTVIR